MGSKAGVAIAPTSIDRYTGKVANAVMSVAGFPASARHYRLTRQVLDSDTGTDGYVVDLDTSKLERVRRRSRAAASPHGTARYTTAKSTAIMGWQVVARWSEAAKA